MLRHLTRPFKSIVCLSLAILLTFNFTKPTFAFPLYSVHPGFIQYVAPFIEMLEGVEAATAVTEAVTATAEALTTAGEVAASGTAVAEAETAALVDGGLLASAWLKVEVNPSTIRAMSHTLGNIVSRGQNVIAKHGNKLVVTAYVAEHGARDVYKAYNSYKAKRQKMGNPLDPCSSVFVRPELGGEGYYFYDSDGCASNLSS